MGREWDGIDRRVEDAPYEGEDRRQQQILPPPPPPEPERNSFHTMLDQLAVPFFVVAMVGALAIAAWITFLRPEPFDPLSYDLQTIEGVNERGEVFIPSVGDVSPAVYSDEVVPVLSRVQNSDDEPVAVRGTVEWQQVTPRGFTCRTTQDRPGIIPPGAEQRRFENVIPDCVREQVGLRGSSEWVITGRVEVDEPNGVDVVWTTQTFTIVPPVASPAQEGEGS